MVLADTGYWLALANARDRWHERAVAASRRLAESLVVTWPVVTETCHLMLSRLGVQAEVRFIEQVARNVELHELGKAHLGTIQALMEKYAALPRTWRTLPWWSPPPSSATGASSQPIGGTSTPTAGRTPSLSATCLSLDQ